MKIFLTLLFLLFAGCQTTTNTNKPANFSAADIEIVVNARLVLYRSDSTESDLKKAEDSLKAIPNSSTEYSEAQSLLKSFERKNGNSKVELPTEVTATEIELGMKSSDVSKLCGSPDDMRSRETAAGRISVKVYEYTEKRSKSRCWGTFTLSL